MNLYTKVEHLIVPNTTETKVDRTVSQGNDTPDQDSLIHEELLDEAL